MKTLFLSLLLLTCSTGLLQAQVAGDRSKTVTVALESTLKKKFADLTAADLDTVTALNLPHIHLPSFKANDFAGLTKLKKLHFFSLFHKSGKPNEPAAFDGIVFAKLSSLEELVIEDELGRLPDDAFAGLTGLKILDLGSSSLLRLPKSLLTLPKIEAVYLRENSGLSKEDYALLKEKLGTKLKPTREKLNN